MLILAKNAIFIGPKNSTRYIRAQNNLVGFKLFIAVALIDVISSSFLVHLQDNSHVPMPNTKNLLKMTHSVSK